MGFCLLETSGPLNLEHDGGVFTKSSSHIQSICQTYKNLGSQVEMEVFTNLNMDFDTIYHHIQMS